MRPPGTAVPGKPSHTGILQVTVSRIPCAGRPGSQDCLTPTRDDNEQVAWENKKTRAEPRNLVLSLKLPTETEQITLFRNNFIPLVEGLLLKGAFFKEEFCRK